MKKYIIYIKSIFLLSIVFFLYEFVNQRDEVRIVKNTTIEFTNEANLFLTHDIVNKMLIQKNVMIKNKPKSLINLQKIEKLIFSELPVENVKAYMTIEGFLKIIITQRTPTARINKGSEVYYIDKYGIKIPLSKNHSARVLLVSGDIKKENMTDISMLVNKIESNEFLKKMIIGIRKSNNDEYILRTRIYDQYIHIGTLENLNLKLKKLEAFHKRTIKDKREKIFKNINLKYSNQVVCSK